MRRAATSAPSVLHINVRLSEGGAAGVAKTLHETLPSLGMNSRFAYGYGPHGSSSPEAATLDATRITPRALVAVNMASHRLLGAESSLRSRTRWLALKDEISRAAVVHLHVVHSYMARVEGLIDLLDELRKPVVWTLHDQWVLTGRCAQPGSCRGYLDGCENCPDLQAYPPATIDRAFVQHPARRDMVSRLTRSERSELVPCALWLEEDARAAGVLVGPAIQNSVDPVFWESISPVSRGPSTGLRALFVCRDLRDKRKVDWEALRRVSEMPGVELTIVGDNAAHTLPSAHHIPSTSDRKVMAEIMQAHDALIFTSRVDYFPLTIAEAVAAGMDIHAIDSMAAREFSDYPSVMLYSTTGDLVLGLRASLEARPPAEIKPGRLAPVTMAKKYMSVYERLMARG